jgi:hypothetical protein
VFRDRSRSAGSRVRFVGAKLKLRGAQAREEAQATVLRITAELADLAELTSRDAEAILDSARRALRRVVGRLGDGCVGPSTNWPRPWTTAVGSLPKPAFGWAGTSLTRPPGW